MKFFTKVLKSKLFYLLLILGVFLIPILKFNLHAQDDYVEVDSTLEFNVVDFTTNELDVDPVTVYNFFRNGFSFNDSVTFLLNDVEYNVISYSINHLKEYTMEFNVGGETYKITSSPTTLNIYSYVQVDDDDVDNLENMRFTWTSSELPFTIPNVVIFDDVVFTSNNTIYNKLYIQLYLTESNQKVRFIRYYKENDDFESILTIGFVNSEYRNIDFISGNLDNSELINTLKGLGTFYDMGQGFDNGDNIKITLRNLIPASYFEFIDEAQYTAKYNDGYNQAREDYGYYDEEADKWLKVDERYQEIYDEGYQDGVDDTHDYYNDNGLFINRYTPKGHLMVEYTPSYGDPYFYLYDLINVGDPFFDFPYTRWLENLFDWAYDNESDFLAINDIYMIPYEHDTHDEMLYKYWFYKYDSDSIYFYNDNGTLLKIVERADFDYYVYEVPELTQEEQARIDNAYNKGMHDYGYYDSESEEYLTAIEYGDIQYNLGVISTRDQAYSDGFVVAMWYSHLYGYDWLHTTYYDLISERPILYTVHDITSFAYQKGHGDGFEDGDSVGYNRGYDWGYEDGKIDGIDIGYDDGYNDGENDGYNLGYQKAVDNTYDAIYDDIYNIGYKDGQKTGMNNKFYSGLEKWIVPAIIVVLFFGLLMLFPKNKED